MSHLEDHETDDGDQNKNFKVQIERKKFDLSDPEVIDDDCISKTQSYRPDLFVFVDIHQNENPREDLFTDLGQGEKDLIKGVRKFIDEESGVEASLEGDTDTPTDSIKITNGAISDLTSETIRDVDESILSRWKLENIDHIFKNEIVDFFKVQGMKLTMRKFSLSRYWVNKWVNGMNSNEVRRSNRQVSIVEADIKGNGDKSGCDETIGDKSPNISVIDRKSLIYEVENGPEIKNIIKEKKAVYSPEFKSQVLDFYTKYGPGVASSKFGINKTLLLQWRRDSGGSYYKDKDPLVKSKTIYSIEFKLKVLDFYKEKGPTAATNKFGINKRQLFDWRKNYSGAYYKNECMDNKKKGYYSPDFKSNVLDFYIEHGPAAATRKFGIAKRQLYDWRKKSGGSYYTNVSAKKKKKSIYTPDFKREVLDFYAENGPKATEEKFGVNQRILFEWRKKNDGIYYNNTVKMRITDCDSHVTENLIGENNHNVKAGHQSCKVSKNVAKINVEYGNDDEVLNPIQRSRKVYDEALKNKVIKYFQKYGRAKTTQEFNIRNSLIYKWIKSGVTPKFSCQFKKDAIKSCKVHVVLTTSKNLHVKL